MNSPAVESSIQKLYELILICRPKDCISFTAEYFEDEKKLDPESNHAMRTLVYLANSSEAHFRNASSTIYARALEKSKTPNLTAEAARTIVSELFDKSYIYPVPFMLREKIDGVIAVPVLGFLEFDIYLRLVVRTSIILHFMKDLLSSACALRMVEGLSSASYDSIQPQDLISCFSTPKIKAIISNMPTFSDPHHCGERDDNTMIKNITAALLKIDKTQASVRVTAVDIVEALLSGIDFGI